MTFLSNINDPLHAAITKTRTLLTPHKTRSFEVEALLGQPSSSTMIIEHLAFSRTLLTSCRLQIFKLHLFEAFISVNSISNLPFERLNKMG